MKNTTVHSRVRLFGLTLVAILFASACSVSSVALDGETDPTTVAIADHLRLHGPVSTLIGATEPLSGAEAACTAGILVDVLGPEGLSDEGVNGPDDVTGWFNALFPWPDDVRLAFNNSLVTCLNETHLGNVDQLVGQALNIQGFYLEPETVRCVTLEGLRTGVLGELWVRPEPGTFDFDLTSDTIDDLTASQRIWADALLQGFEACLGLGGLVAQDLQNLGLALSARTKACIGSESSDVSVTEAWQAGQTLPEMSDPIINSILGCLSPGEVAQLSN
ncbi:MAG: hypothetical protein OEU32_05655 [Acidimicrobiia bacterium]|nr:hypothetical protein [Acidimicrobiia bacterium]